MTYDLLSATYSESLVGKSHHFHDEHQLLYIVKGEVELLVNGRREVARDGCLLLFSRFEEHSITIKSEEYKRYSLRISPDFGRTREKELLFAVLVNRSPNSGNVFYPTREREEIEALFHKITEEYLGKSLLREEMLSALLRQMLITVCRMMPEDGVREQDENVSLIYRIQARLESDYREKFTLAQLAAEHHVSVSYLSHLFKEITGTAVMEYLFACRLLAAKRLLATTELSVGEVVEACGFCDDSNFSRSFKQRVGMTPSDFRKQYQSES